MGRQQAVSEATASVRAALREIRATQYRTLRDVATEDSKRPVIPAGAIVTVESLQVTSTGDAEAFMVSIRWGPMLMDPTYAHKVLMAELVPFEAGSAYRMTGV